MIALAQSGNVSIGGVSLSSISSDVLLFFLIVAGAAIAGIIFDVLITAYFNNSIKNSTETVLNTMLSATNAAINANQNAAAQAIDAMLLLAGINDVQHMVDKKMIRELHSLSSGLSKPEENKVTQQTSQPKPEEKKETPKPAPEENKEIPKPEPTPEPKPQERSEEKK
jgi:outer membrane biosynthesis protein TonB